MSDQPLPPEIYEIHSRLIAALPLLLMKDRHLAQVISTKDYHEGSITLLLGDLQAGLSKLLGDGNVTCSVKFLNPVSENEVLSVYPSSLSSRSEFRKLEPELLKTGSVVARVYQTAAPVTIQSREKWEASGIDSAFPGLKHISSLVAFPIRDEKSGNVLGVLNVDSPSEHAFPDIDTVNVILQCTADTIAVLLQVSQGYFEAK